MKTAFVLLVMLVVIGVSALAAVLARTPAIAPESPTNGGGPIEGDPAMPTLELAWARVGEDVVVTVTRADPEEPLDCRWLAWAHDTTAGADVPFPAINLTNGVAPAGGSVCIMTDPRLDFHDKDADHMLSVGDEWVLRGVPLGTEYNLELGLGYWGVHQQRFRWPGGTPQGR